MQAVSAQKQYGKSLAAHMDVRWGWSGRTSLRRTVCGSTTRTCCGSPGVVRRSRTTPGATCDWAAASRTCAACSGVRHQRRHRHRRRELLGQSEHVRGDAHRVARLQGAWSRLAAVDHDQGGARGGDRGQCARARLREARPPGARLQGGHRVPRPRQRELDSAQRRRERSWCTPRTARRCTR